MKYPLRKLFWCRLGSFLMVLWEEFYSIKLQILDYYKSFYWGNMLSARITFSGQKEICYTVLNEPHSEPMEQQIFFSTGRRQSYRGIPAQFS